MSIQNNFPAIKPTLLLDFANVKQLDPRITFTRASTATYYGTQTAKAEENLILYSEQLSNGAGWSTSNITADGNTDTAPNGTITADRITSNSTPTQCGISSITAIFSASQPLTVSVFAKAGSATFLQIFIPTSVLSGGYANFNLSTGAVGNFGGTGLTASIVSVGNSWYRCSVSIASVSASATDAATFYMVDSATAARGSNFSTNSQSMLLWGAQLEQRSAVTAYTATTTQAITNYIPQLLTAASGVARFDHNPVTDESLGLLIEEQRVNLALYSSQFDDATWADSSATSTTRTANQIIAPDGTLSADLILNTTATNRHTFQQSFTIASSSTVYSASVYAKRYVGSGTAPYFVFYIGNSFQGTDRAGLVIDTSTFEVVNTTFENGLATLANYSVTPAGNSWYRVSITGSINTVAATTLRLCLGISNTNVNAPLSNPYAGDGLEGVYLWGAQLEAGAFATSYIPTVASQVTRAADAASMTGTNFSSWYNVAEGTFFAQFRPMTSNFGTNKNMFLASDGTTANYVGLRYGSSGSQAAMAATTSAVLQANIVTGAMIAGTSYKLAGAYTANAFAASRDAGTVGADTNGTVPVVTQAEIGMLAGTSFGTQTIRKLAYYPLRVTNAQLQALTS